MRKNAFDLIFTKCQLDVTSPAKADVAVVVVVAAVVGVSVVVAACVVAAFVVPFQLHDLLF